MKYFVDNHIDIVRIDVVFPAGTVVQEKPLQSSTAIRLITEGTARHSAREIADFFDFRGMAVEKNVDEVTSSITVYTLRRYLDDLLPLLREIILSPVYPDDEFRLYVNNRRRRLLTEMMRTSYVARNLFYEQLYGHDHPMGAYAVPEDFERLTVDDVRRFHEKHFSPEDAVIIASGHVDNQTLELFDRHFGDFATHGDSLNLTMPQSTQTLNHTVINHDMSNANCQNTLRVGRLLPMRWDSVDYARTVVLSTVLGGYFGSRLMSNIREDKGYTYGIYSQTRICRGSLVFSIQTDVASDKAKPALNEIFYELQTLCEQPVAVDELNLVRRCMIGDFLRSVDGIFERCERYFQQLSAGIDERFTDNFFNAVDNVTPEELQQIAKQLFRPEELLVVNVGKTV